MEVDAVFCTRMDITKMFVMSLDFAEIKNIKNMSMGMEILCVEPLYPQYSGVLETCLALRYWFFEVLGSESAN